MDRIVDSSRLFSGKMRANPARTVSRNKETRKKQNNYETSKKG